MLIYFIGLGVFFLLGLRYISGFCGNSATFALAVLWPVTVPAYFLFKLLDCLDSDTFEKFASWIRKTDKSDLDEE